MKATTKYVIVLQDISSKRFLGQKLGCKALALDSLNFAQTFKSTARAERRMESLNAALRKKDVLSEKPGVPRHFTRRVKRFIVRFISENKWLNSDPKAKNPHRPAL